MTFSTKTASKQSSRYFSEKTVFTKLWSCVGTTRVRRLKKTPTDFSWRQVINVSGKVPHFVKYLRPLNCRNSPLGESQIQSNLSPQDHRKGSVYQGVHFIRVFTTSGCSLHQGFTTSGCSLHQGVHYIRVFTTSGCSLHQGVYYISAFTTSGCSLHQGVHYIRVFTTSGCSLHQGVHYIRMFTTPGCSLRQI